MNLAARYLEMTGQTVEDYDGFCIDLAGDVVENFGGEAIIWQDDAGPWRYHAAAVVGGVVHDAWLREPLTEQQWLDTWDGRDLWRSDGE